jgi:D-amino-acid oxidase
MIDSVCARLFRCCQRGDRRARKKFADGSTIRPYHSIMNPRVAIVGAGVSGLTCGIVFAEGGSSVKIFGEKVGTETTSGAAGALWFPYDAEPADKVIPWALATYKVLVDLAKNRKCGVSMLELRQYCRAGKIEVPSWASRFVIPDAAFLSSSKVGKSPDISAAFSDGFALRVPLADTTIYLDYLIDRLQKAGGEIEPGVRLEQFEHVDRNFDLIINCAGIGARELAQDPDLEPHRGQVAIVPKLADAHCAIVCDDDPLMYVIPRTNDCVFGGTNDVSDDWNPDPDTTKSILAECSRVLEIEAPRVVRERVGLRPFRKLGVRLEKEKLGDGRTVIHNYGHGGSGFTLSWGCAAEVVALAS